MGPAYPQLFVITDHSVPDLLNRVESVCALRSKIALVHRNPGATARAYFAQAKVLAELCSAHSVPLFIHGRLDVALLLDAHLHLPASGLTAAEVRPHFPRWLSRSVHDEAEAADSRGADFALISPVFAPNSKPAERPPIGLGGLEHLASCVHAHPIALGGIDPSRAATISPHYALAAIGSVLHAPDPLGAAAALLATRR